MDKNKNKESKGTLYLIPNVIADNTEPDVISPQVKEIISGLDYFLVENLRTARRYISKLKLGLIIEDLEFVLLDKNTDTTNLEAMMKPLSKGKNAGVISESGCPGIADPGSMAVKYAHRNGIQVVPVSGPSSIFLSLMASGFNGQSFTFHGYLPIKKESRVKAIRELEKLSQKHNQTQIFIETPYRNNPMMQDLINTCHPQTQLCLAADLSGPNELILSQRIVEWKKNPVKIEKVPAVFLIYLPQ